MIEGGGLRFLRNAFSNVVNGASSALFAIVLPYFFVRYFSRSEFSLWVLVLQLGAYVNYLNFGLQVAVGRFVAHSLERGDRSHAEGILAAAIQTLSVLAIVGVIIMAGIGLAFPHLFPQVTPELQRPAMQMLFWIGGSLALGLPFSAFLGVMIGLQRNEVPAAITAIGKFISGGALILIALYTRDLVIVAQGYFATNAAIYIVQYVAFRRMCPEWTLRLFQNTRAFLKELISYCASLTGWSLAMLLVGGIGTAIVGYYDFRAVAPFGAALSIVNFLAGLIQALATPLVQVFARQQARGDLPMMIRLLGTSSLLYALILFLTAAWLALLADSTFRFWIGPVLAHEALPIFIVLIIANAIRSTTAPYANFLIATGQQNRVIISPLIEGFANLLFSIFAARMIGAMGVAYGAVFGAITAITINGLYNYPRTLPAGFSAIRFLLVTLLQPTAYSLPMITILVAGAAFGWPLHWRAAALLLASLPVLSEVTKEVRQMRGDDL